MQDQMRFEFEDGTWIDFDAEFPSNHNGTIKKCGIWAQPIFPSNRSIQGSPKTPYIWDDRCKSEDAADAIHYWYNMEKSTRQSYGLAGREWAISEAGFTSKQQATRVIEAFDTLFSTWKPREKFEFINTNETQPKVIKHKLLY
jgi:hypothetical protein